MLLPKHCHSTGQRWNKTSPLKHIWQSQLCYGVLVEVLCIKQEIKQCLEWGWSSLWWEDSRNQTCEAAGEISVFQLFSLRILQQFFILDVYIETAFWDASESCVVYMAAIHWELRQLCAHLWWLCKYGDLCFSDVGLNLIHLSEIQIAPHAQTQDVMDFLIFTKLYFSWVYFETESYLFLISKTC